MHDIIIIRYSEIALKGKNRGQFENRLVLNIRDCLTKSKVTGKVIRMHGRIHIETESFCPALARVFGIASFSHAKSLEFDIESIKDEIVKQLKGKRFSSFRISAHRLDETIAMSTRQMNEELGRFVVEKTAKKVSLKEAELDIGIEVRGKQAFVFTDHLPGPGGLPLGSTGKALAILDDEKSLLAAWMVMRRGVRLYPVGSDFGLLEHFNYGFEEMKEVPFSKRGCVAAVSGQTLREVADIETNLMILRPLVGLNNDEIKTRLKNIRKMAES